MVHKFIQVTIFDDIMIINNKVIVVSFEYNRTNWEPKILQFLPKLDLENILGHLENCVKSSLSIEFN